MIISKSRVKLKSPIMICSWPGLGMVGNYVVNYLISTLKPSIFAHIEMEKYYVQHNVIVSDGIIFSPIPLDDKFYLYRTQQKDIIFFVSDVQPFPHLMFSLSKEIVDFAVTLKTSMLITFAGIPSNVLHTDIPHVYIAKTDPEIVISTDENYKEHILKGGSIEGMNGVILGVAKEAGIAGVCFLTEIPVYALDTENPQAGLKVLSILTKFLSLEINFDKVYKDITKFDNMMKKLFADLNQKAQKLILQFESSNFGSGYGKKLDFNFGGISLSELEKKLKFSLPESAKNKIEELFNSAAKDIKYAKELKQELDKWGVYKDYEDRFLSLFLKDTENKEEKKDNSS